MTGFTIFASTLLDMAGIHVGPLPLFAVCAASIWYLGYKDIRLSSNLMPLLEGVHGDATHAGKAPRRGPKLKAAATELESLRRRLGKLVADEKYEDAARVRDQLRRLEEG